MAEMMGPRTVLVPLDGSAPAEAALPYAEAIARLTGAGLRLFSVVEREPRGLTNRSEETAARLENTARAGLEDYLAAAETELRERGAAVTSTVVTGDPTNAILAAAEADQGMLIAMATRGRGALDRWAIGSVADKVMRLSGRPTLLVRPPYLPLRRRDVELQRLMTPLDGSPLAEQALASAGMLAGKAGAELILARVEPWRTEGLAPPGSVPEYDEQEADAANVAAAYLEGVRRRLPEGLRTEVIVLRGRPAATLVDFALHERLDLIVMTTHGWGGLRRLVLGSTADRLVRAGVPTLLLRPDGR